MLSSVCMWSHPQVVSGLAEIVCPIPECSGYLAESVVLAHLASEHVAKYKYFLELGRLDSGTKTCPKCSLFTSLKGRGQPVQNKDEPKFKVQTFLLMYTARGNYRG